MDTQMVLTHTGKIYFNRSLGLEFLTVGDYGKENNIKADFLGLTKKIEGVQHHDVDLKTTLFGVRCEFGRIACVDGGTKKTKMYGRVYSEAKNSERYHKLSYPNNTYIAKIGDGAFLAPPYVRIERGPDSRLFCHNPGFGCNRLFVSIDELTPDNINRICTYHPRAMLGGEIESYQTETIPIFLHQLSKLFPEQYSTFIKAFPDYELKAPDYRGKYAKLSTCNRELASEPWMCCGTLVVKLEGKSGGYAVDGLNIISE